MSNFGILAYIHVKVNLHLIYDVQISYNLDYSAQKYRLIWIFAVQVFLEAWRIRYMMKNRNIVFDNWWNLWYSSIAEVQVLWMGEPATQVFEIASTIFGMVEFAIFFLSFRPCSSVWEQKKKTVLNFRTRSTDKSVYWKSIFFLSHPKHMLWVLKRTVSMRRFFWAPKIHV